MAADCKSAAPCELRRFESSPVHQVRILQWDLSLADVAQLVEHSLGKGEVTSSILVISSRFLSGDESIVAGHGDVGSARGRGLEHIRRQQVSWRDCDHHRVFCSQGLPRSSA